MVANLPSRRGLQTSSEGKCKRKVELVELALNGHSMKLAKVSEGETENEDLFMAELLATDEGVLLSCDQAFFYGEGKNKYRKEGCDHRLAVCQTQHPY